MDDHLNTCGASRKTTDSKKQEQNDRLQFPNTPTISTAPSSSFRSVTWGRRSNLSGSSINFQNPPSEYNASAGMPARSPSRPWERRSDMSGSSLNLYSPANEYQASTGISTPSPSRPLERRSNMPGSSINFQNPPSEYNASADMPARSPSRPWERRSNMSGSSLNLHSPAKEYHASTEISNPSHSRLMPSGHRKADSSDISSPASSDIASAGMPSMTSPRSARGNRRPRHALSDIVSSLGSMSLKRSEKSSMKLPWDSTDFQPTKVASQVSIPEYDEKQRSWQHMEQPQSSDFLEGLPSLGSAEHASGHCRPCAFFHKVRGCHQMQNCTFCHLCTKDYLLIKKKLRKKERVAFQEEKSVAERSREQTRESTEKKPCLPQRHDGERNPRQSYGANIEKTPMTMTALQKEYSYPLSTCEPALEFRTPEKLCGSAPPLQSENVSSELRIFNSPPQSVDHKKNVKRVPTPSLDSEKQNLKSTLSFCDQFGMTSTSTPIALNISLSDLINQSTEIPRTAKLGQKSSSHSEENSERRDAFVDKLPALVGDVGKLAEHSFAADEERGLLSRSSYEAHLAGTCTPCMFGYKLGGCKKGDQCDFCHFCDKEKCRYQKTLRAKIGRQLKKRGLTSKEQYMASSSSPADKAAESEM